MTFLFLNLKELKEHVDIAYATWIERNQLEWELDLSLITSNGFVIVNHVNKTNRKNIMENKIENKMENKIV